jgi:hypothetical protein
MLVFRLGGTSTDDDDPIIPCIQQFSPAGGGVLQLILMIQSYHAYNELEEISFPLHGKHHQDNK